MVPPSIPPPGDIAQLLQLVMDNIPQFIFWKDRESRYLGCNVNFARVAGLQRPDQIVGKTDFDLAWREDEARFFREVDERVMTSGKPEYRILEPQQQADGKQAWVVTNKVPLRDAHGRVVGILGTYEDVTEQRALEERLRHAEKMESVGKLAGGVAHDFNNMLAGISGATELLARRIDEDARSRELVGIIRQATERAASITAQLLEFSRKAPRREEPFRLHAALRSALEILEPGMSGTIEVTALLVASDDTVLGDHSRVVSALVNVGLNSRDAMPGGGRLEFRSRNVDVDDEGAIDGVIAVGLHPGRHIELVVTDTGLGMDQEVADRAFEPFFTTKDVGEGTGLGLAALYGTVTEHGGTVSIESRAGSGTAVRIVLPVAPATIARPGTPATDGEPEPEPEPARARGRLLVVDDEEVVRSTATFLLEGLGYEVLVAADAETAERLHERHRGDLDGVLLDVRMPRKDGLACFRTLRAAEPGLPIVLMSGYAPSVRLEELGDDVAVLRKPFTRLEVAQTLQRALSTADRKVRP